MTPDPTQRVVSEGVEVLAGAPILLVHSATQMPLIVQDQRYPTEFGSELELSARQSTSAGMKMCMELTAKVGEQDTGAVRHEDVHGADGKGGETRHRGS